MVRQFSLALAPFAVMALLAACQTGGTFCDIARPLRPSDAAVDAMKDADVAELLAHNEKGRKLCGWKERGAGR